MSTTTTDPTALTIDGAAATLAALPDSPDVRTAAAMLAAAPTTPVGTLRKWMTAHDGETVDTLQFRTWCGHDTLAIWAPTDRTIDASRAGSVRFNGSTLDYRGVRVIGADDVSIVTLSDEFLTVYRLSSARPAPGAAEGDTTTRVAAGQTRQAPRESTIVPVNDSGELDILMSNYKVKGDWIDITSETNTFPALDEVSIETCSLTHTDGFGREHTIPYGAHRVKAPGKRARTFKGETAWMDAERLAGDWQSEIQRCDDCGPPTEDAAPTAEPVRYIYVETTNEEGRHNESIGPFPTAEDATAFLPLALADPSWSIIDAEVRADYEAPLVAHWVHEWPAWIAERSNEWGGDAPEWSLALLAWQDEHPDMWAKVEAAVAP